ncbi:hypothetical protein K6W21_01490 [Burkholderia latens]|uniref:hypothetical protein n=1 Tax=Burkholderia latens TaxID=488446 RepID=UPI001C94C2E1|nr:hypothetical protein [Burkholderia latens]MBY4692761.1 hypothetical protein [Burkholderia latens]
MILTVQVPAGRHCFKRKHGMGPAISSEMHRPLVTTVFRIGRIPSVKRQLLAVVEVDAFIPERHRTHIAPSDPRWVRPGVLRTKAYWIDNKKSQALGQFLTSDAPEIDLRDEV